MKKIALIAVAAMLVAAGGATAQSLITSADIKNRTIKKKDLSRKTVNQLKGATGPAGPQGPQGPPGPAGGSAGGGTLKVLLQASGTTAVADLLAINGQRLQGGCEAGRPVLRSQTTVDNGAIRSIAENNANTFYSNDNNFDIGDTVNHLNANTDTDSIVNVAFVSFTGDVVTELLGVTANPTGFDCLIHGTASVP